MRIASLNALSDPERFLERLEQICVEARDAGVEVLALQEIPGGQHGAIRQIARDNGFPAQHLESGRAGDGLGTFGTSVFDDSGTVTVSHGTGSRKFSWVRLRGVWVLNVHLTWGAHNEPARLEEVAALDAFAAARHDEVMRGVADAQEPLFVLAGDCNAEPDNDCIRFLRGKTGHAGRGTYWTEATLGTDLESVPTTREKNFWGRRTAASKGLDPDTLPPRRIDFLFVRGWRHGNRGTPTGTRRFGVSITPSGFEVSDHYGWVTDLQE